MVYTKPILSPTNITGVVVFLKKLLIFYRTHPIFLLALTIQNLLSTAPITGVPMTVCIPSILKVLPSWLI